MLLLPNWCDYRQILLLFSVPSVFLQILLVLVKLGHFLLSSTLLNLPHLCIYLFYFLLYLFFLFLFIFFKEYPLLSFQTWGECQRKIRYHSLFHRAKLRLHTDCFKSEAIQTCKFIWFRSSRPSLSRKIFQLIH